MTSKTEATLDTYHDYGAISRGAAFQLLQGTYQPNLLLVTQASTFLRVQVLRDGASDFTGEQV